MVLVKLSSFNYIFKTFPSDKYSAVNENKKTHFYKNGILIKVISCHNLEQVSVKSWYDKLEKVLYVFCQGDIRIFRLKNIKYNFSFGLQGLYLYSKTDLYFFNYKTSLVEKILISNFSIKADIIYFLDNECWCREEYLFKMVKKEFCLSDQTKFLNKLSCEKTEPLMRKVHFKDQTSTISITELLQFESVYIQDQLSSQNLDIYLDLEYADFNLNNSQTLNYLNSKLLIKKLFVEKFLSCYT